MLILLIISLLTLLIIGIPKRSRKLSK